jgi:hypothetical protein
MQHNRTNRPNDNRSSMRGSSMHHQPPMNPQQQGYPPHHHQNQQHKPVTSSPYSQRSQSNVANKVHQSKRALSYNNVNSQQQHRKRLTFDGHVVEELSELLGFPDLYEPETNAKYHDTDYVPEMYFSREFAQEGYRDIQFKRRGNPPIYPYGTFITTLTQVENEPPATSASLTPSKDNTPPSNIKKISFIDNLRVHEASLRGEWKTFSTRKIREERKILHDNATKACQCDTPKIGFPDMASDDGMDQWMEELGGNGLRKMFHSLRDLSTRIPHGYVFNFTLLFTNIKCETDSELKELFLCLPNIKYHLLELCGV